MLSTYLKHEASVWRHVLPAAVREAASFAQKTVFWAALAVLCLLLFHTLSGLWDISVWRHDALIYYDSYGWKLREEGRWLNFLVFAVLKAIPPHLGLLASLAALFYFSYICAISVTSRKNALVFALCTLHILPFYSLAGWPLTPLPSYLLLAAAAFLSLKLDFRILFPLFGILFHGSFNNFYNLLPLLFLGRLWQNKIKLTPLLCYYVLGFLAGFCVAEAMTFLATGQAIQIAAWRFPNPIHSLTDLALNVAKAWRSFFHHLHVLGALPLAAAMFCTALLVFKRERERFPHI